MKPSFIVTRAEGFYNQRQKYFVDKEGHLHLWEVMTFPTACFNPQHLEAIDGQSNSCSSDDGENAQKGSPSYKGRSRAKKRFFDAVMANWELDTMSTLTFNPDKVDRSDYKAIIRKLNTWLDNRVRRKGLMYLLIPEYHKDGVSIHFHGFMNSSALQLVDSGHKQKGRKVYNIADFPFGFTTAVKLDKNRERAAWYCYKYITKETVRIGGRYVLQGGAIRKPTYIYVNVDYVEAVGETISLADGLTYKVETRG